MIKGKKKREIYNVYNRLLFVVTFLQGS